MMIIPAEEVSKEEMIVSAGLELLIILEVKSWIKKGILDAAISSMEYLTSSTVVGLAGMVGKKTGSLKTLR